MNYSNKDLLLALRECGERRIALGRYATGGHYLQTARSYAQFLCACGLMRGARFDAATVLRYAGWLRDERRCCHNTVAYYLRHLRAACNACGGDGPTAFRAVCTVPQRTRKRALQDGVIAGLAALPLSGTLAMWRDLFLFCFAARGMAFVDAAHLRKSDVAGGYISYRRHKTGRQLLVRLEPCMEQVIARWRSPEGSPFLFPVLTASGTEGWRQYASRLAMYNRALRTLGRRVGCPDLSSYAARHSWATAAHRAGVPVGVISEGLGHSSERTTQIYLASFDVSVLDEANRQVLCGAGL